MGAAAHGRSVTGDGLPAADCDVGDLAGRLCAGISGDGDRRRALDATNGTSRGSRWRLQSCGKRGTGAAEKREGRRGASRRLDDETRRIKEHDGCGGTAELNSAQQRQPIMTTRYDA